ncbi:MG328/MPN474 family protein [Mycoplasmoides genitalium]
MAVDKELEISDFDNELDEKTLLKELVQRTNNILFSPSKITAIPFERNLLEKTFFGTVDEAEKEKSIVSFFNWMIDLKVLDKKWDKNVLNHYANQLKTREEEQQTVDQTMAFQEVDDQSVLTKEIKTGFQELKPSVITAEDDKDEIKPEATKQVSFEELFNQPSEEINETKKPEVQIFSTDKVKEPEQFDDFYSIENLTKAINPVHKTIQYDQNDDQPFVVKRILKEQHPTKKVDELDDYNNKELLLENADLKKQIDDLKENNNDQIFDLEQEIDDLKRRLSEEKSKHLHTKKLQDDLLQENRDLYEQLQNKPVAINPLSDEVNEELENLKQEKALLSDQLDALKNKSSNVQQQLALLPVLNNQINELQNQLLTAREANQRLDLVEQENDFLKNELKKLHDNTSNDENEKYDDLLNQYELLFDENETKFDKLQVKQQALNLDYQKTISALKHENDVLLDEIEWTRSKDNDFNNTKNSFEEQKKALDEKLNGLTIQNQQLQDKIAELEEWNEEKSNLNTNQLVNLQQQLKDSQNLFNVAQDKLATLEEVNLALNEKINDLEDELSGSENSNNLLVKLQADHEILQESYGKLKTDFEKLKKNKLNDANEQYQDLLSAFEETNSELEKAKQSLSASDSENNQLKQQINSLENAKKELQFTPVTSDEHLDELETLKIEKEQLFLENQALQNQLQYFNDISANQTEEIKEASDEDKPVEIKKPRIKKRDFVIQNKDDKLAKLSKKERIQAYAERLAKINANE